MRDYLLWNFIKKLRYKSLVGQKTIFLHSKHRRELDAMLESNIIFNFQILAIVGKFKSMFGIIILINTLFVFVQMFRQTSG